MSETPSRPPTQEELHSPDYQPPKREDAQAVHDRQQSELEKQRDYHNRRTAGQLTDEEKEGTALENKTSE